MAERAANPIGDTLSRLRRERGWTLAEVSRLTGVSISSLSKIENGVSAPAYSVLVRLAEGLKLDIGMLLVAPSETFGSGVRVVTRRGDGMRYANEMGEYEDVAAGLSGKTMQPMIIEIPFRTGGEKVRSEHRGQEYVHVLKGAVVFEMAPHPPVTLSEGDSLYFDSAVRHGFSACSPEGARILSVCQAQRPMPVAREPETGSPLPAHSNGTP